MLKLQKNRGKLLNCDKCDKESTYHEDYFWNTNTGDIVCERCK